MTNEVRTGVCAPIGFRATGIACGVRVEGRLDLALVASDHPATAAGLFTTNLVCGAPVTISRRHLANGTARAIVANTGFANACTGAKGEDDAREMCAAVGKSLGIATEDVLVASTGIIGRPIPLDRIVPGIATAAKALSADTGDLAAQAIMTTDTVPKQVQLSVEIGGKTVTIGGIAKGAGMIAPRLATMLAFLTTDAEIEHHALRALLVAAADASFNRLTIDGDTSTSDMLLVLANGAAGAPRIEPGTQQYETFGAALRDACVELAKMIARDGEGATTFLTVHVTGAPTDDDAHRAARTVAESPLVKTAVFGGDPNWGRIAAALGRSGVAFDANRLRIRADDILLFENGQPARFDLRDAEKRFRQKVLTIHAELGAGSGESEVYTCDLSYDYVKINAEYTT